MARLQRGGGLDQDVHPLARARAGSGSRRAAPSAGNPKCCAGRRPFVVIERAEAVDVDAGRHQHARQRPTSGALALGQRVATGGDHQPGASEHVAEDEVRVRAAGRAP